MYGTELEKQLKKNKLYASTMVGGSMRPMLRARRDTVVIECVQNELQPFDVALYHIPGGKYILHRILRVKSDKYIICGDNCMELEYVPKEWVLGKLTKFYRDEKEINMQYPFYRFYVFFWCKPWKARILVLRIRRCLGRIRRRLIERR